MLVGGISGVMKFFRKKHEFLRKSLFWNIYRDVMVFKKISDGMNYRNYCVKHGKPCPTIITIDDGETIEVRKIPRKFQKKFDIKIIEHWICVSW